MNDTKARILDILHDQLARDVQAGLITSEDADELYKDRVEELNYQPTPAFVGPIDDDIDF